MNILDYMNFKYCPSCGEPNLQSNDPKSLVCLSCGFIYYHSPVAVAVGIVEYEDQIIITKRAREPQKGLLALPGGFVDYQESLESALARELHEELNLSLSQFTYLCSYWEKYLFREVVCFSTIAFFIVRTDDIAMAEANDDIEPFFLVRPQDIDSRDLAFVSDRVALDNYRKVLQ